MTAIQCNEQHLEMSVKEAPRLIMGYGQGRGNHGVGDNSLKKKKNYSEKNLRNLPL